MHVAWFTLEDLCGLIRRHRVDDTVSKADHQDRCGPS
jgi:hypothetical protein